MSPLNQMFRTAAVDDRIGDTPVQAGDRIVLLYPSANRDESVFADPFRFDITREPNPHLAFGFGPHVCIGQSLARLELQVLFAEMARRFTNLRVDQRARDRAEHLRWRGAAIRARLRASVERCGLRR